MKRRITEERGERRRGGGSVLGETGESGPGKVAGQVRERVERGLRETKGGKRGNDKKRSIGQC